MTRDRYERRHRRTAKNINAVEAMANADFDAVPPSLSEAMGLEEPSVTHTHVSTTTSASEYAAECAADDAAAEAAIVHDQAETAARRGAGLPEPEPTTDAF